MDKCQWEIKDKAGHSGSWFNPKTQETEAGELPQTQAVLSSMESSRIAWSLVWGPISEGKGRTCTIPWHAWWSSTVHSLRGCCELPGFTSHQDSPGSPPVSTTLYISTNLSSEAASCPPWPYLHTQTASWTGRAQPCEFINRLSSWALSPGPGLPQAHHCQMFSKSFFS